ncbi:MAG: CHASE2 domain-containing protein [Thermoleophilaceae bacterium]
MLGGRRKLRGFMLVAVVLASVATTIAAYSFHVLRQPERSTVDARFAIRGSEGPPKDVVVVQIDDSTFNRLGVQWPFPRSLHGELIDRLSAAGARVIAFDVQFTEATTKREDGALIDAVGRAQTLVLATTEVDPGGLTRIFGGDAVLHSLKARPADSVLPPDSGGVIRRMPYSVDKLGSFGVVTAERYLGHRVNHPASGTAWIDFRGPPGTVRTVSYGDVITGRVPRSVFQGKIVVVGPSAPSLQDVHPTSTTGNSLMSGAELQANTVDTALRGFPLDSTARWVDILLIVLFGVVPLAGLRLGVLRGALAMIALGALYAVAVQLAFDSGTILPFFYPVVALLLSTVGALAISYITAAFERERVREIFARFVPAKVVDEVLEQTDGTLRLGGEASECTVLFSDLRGFTTFSETRDAADVIEILNRYLGEMTAAIMSHGGTLVSYIGDGIMAVFGAPIEQPDHADRALAAAREMLGPRLDAFNSWMREQGVADRFAMGVGLNTGVVVTGNVGSQERLEYTAIGDTTNTASRLEGMTKGSGFHLFMADSTIRSMISRPDDVVFVDELPVRGRSKPVEVWSVANGNRAQANGADPAAEPLRPSGIPG